MSQVLEKHQLPPDIVLQVTDMTREAIDKALRQLTANGGGKPQQAQGYQFPARTPAELRGKAATQTLVPDSQKVETGEAEPQQVIYPDKELPSGWSF